MSSFLVVARRRLLTRDVCEFVLRRADNSALPPKEPGAHINVDTPSGETRSYSLTGAVHDRSRHIIAVRRDEDGRGGSRSMVDEVAEGDELRVSLPHNDFALEDAPGFLLVAAGIGITPIRAMALELRRRGIRDVHLVYLSRSPEETPYLDELQTFLATDEPGAIIVHHRREHGAFDWWPLLEHPAQRRLYVCGPLALQSELRALTMHWRPSRVHMENFSGVSAFGEISLPFRAVWQPKGAEFSGSVDVTVPAGQTFLSALRAEDIDVASSCESGTCGTCRLRLIAGEADHRDVVLTEQERAHYVMPCVSRARSDVLVVAPLS